MRDGVRKVRQTHYLMQANVRNYYMQFEDDPSAVLEDIARERAYDDPTRRYLGPPPGRGGPPRGEEYAWDCHRGVGLPDPIANAIADFG